MAKLRAFHLFLLTLLVTMLVAASLFWSSSPVARWELRAGDLLARYGRKTPANDKIVFLAIDSESISSDLAEDLGGLFGIEDPQSEEAQVLGQMARGWPWPRTVYPHLLDRLFGAGAAAVVFDLNFLKPTDQDDAFRASLEKYRDRVVIGSNFVDWERVGVANPHVTHKAPTETLIPAGEEGDSRVGFTSFGSDVDGVVRDASFQASIMSISGRQVPGDTPYTSLAAQAVRKLGHPERVPVDTESRTLRLTAWPGQGFPPRSAFELFVPEYWKRNYRSGEVFRGATVVIGAAGNWQQDVHLTALGVMPGPELQCNAINALLQGGFLRRASGWTSLALIFAGAFCALALHLSFVSPVARLFWLVAAGVGYIGAARYFYNAGDLFLPMVSPMSALVLNGLGGLLYDFGAVRRERLRLRSTFERYVSKNVVSELMSDSRSYLHSLGGEVRPVTILFSDIRNFTRVCANTEATELVRLLNEYLTVMVDCAFRYGGTLDKFIGDAIMVVWGNVRSAGAMEDARQALECALAMQRELARLNARWEKQGQDAFRIGIALNHGDVVAGSIGSPHRMEVTVIGDAVNVCWRLQERTKLHPGGLILGESLAGLLGPKYPMIPLGSIVVGETLESQYYCLANQVEVEEGAVAEAVAH